MKTLDLTNHYDEHLALELRYPTRGGLVGSFFGLANNRTPINSQTITGDALEKWRAVAPYCLSALSPCTFIWLNRGYRPLGVAESTPRGRTYAEYPDMIFAPSPELLAKILAELRGGYFFDDATSPFPSGQGSKARRQAYWTKVDRVHVLLQGGKL